MKTVKDFDFKDNRVLLRVDFNVPISSSGQILDDFRIQQSLPTIEYLKKSKSKIILISHLGGKEKSPASEPLAQNYSLEPISLRLEKLLGQKVKFLGDCLGEGVYQEIEKLQPSEVALLENLRLHSEEEANDPNFARALAELGDIYINDGFSVCHRAHASVVGIPKYLPAGAGISLEKEIKILSRVLERPWRPLIAIIGGVKISTKIKVIEKFLEVADHLLLGSKLAETIFIANDILVGRKLPEKEILDRIKSIPLTNPKLHLPTDGVMALAGLEQGYSRIGAIGTVRKEEEIFDIGPETIKIFSEIIKEAKMIIWNGPVGYFERSPFDEGTKKVVEAICKNQSAYKIAGGGETDSYLYQAGLREKFDYVSTGGGAMLEFLAGEKLPGIEALK